MANKNPSREYNFKPGQSGNPKGRPPGVKSLTRVLTELMDATEIKLEVKMKVPGKDFEIHTFNIRSSETMKYAVSLSMISQAIGGNVQAINSIFDRLEGKNKPSEGDGGEDEFKNLSVDDKRKKIIELFPRVA